MISELNWQEADQLVIQPCYGKFSAHKESFRILNPNMKSNKRGTGQEEMCNHLHYNWPAYRF